MSKPPLDIKNPTLAAAILRRLGAQERANQSLARRAAELERQVVGLQQEVSKLRRRELSRAPALVLGPEHLELSLAIEGRPFVPEHALQALERAAGAPAVHGVRLDIPAREPFLQRWRRRIGLFARASLRVPSAPAAARRVADDCQ